MVHVTFDKHHASPLLPSRILSDESSWARPCLFPPALHLFPAMSSGNSCLQADIAFVIAPGDLASIATNRMRITARLIILLQNGAGLARFEKLDGVRVVLASKGEEYESFEDFDSVATTPQCVGGKYEVDYPGLRCCRYIRLRVFVDGAAVGDGGGTGGQLFAVIRDVQFLDAGCSVPPLLQQIGSIPVSDVLPRLLHELHGDRADLLSHVVLTRHTNAPAWDKYRRVWNGLIDRFPAIIIVARSEDDVCRTVALAHELRLEITVKGGGHNVAGSAVADGALMIDLSRLNEISVHVDRSPPRVTVGGGCTWAAVDAALHPHGLAVPAGANS